MDAYRESRRARSRRQLSTVPKALRAGRARARVDPLRARPVDGPALCRLLTEAGAEAELVEIRVDRPPWATTVMQVSAGDQISWFAWGVVHLVKPLGIAATPSLALGVRVAGGALQRSTRDTSTFPADSTGRLELAGLAPAGGAGELGADGSVRKDRFPYRAITGPLHVVVARWPAGTDVRARLAAIAERDASGLCRAETERLAEPPTLPPGWSWHPLSPPQEVYRDAEAGVRVDTRRNGGIIRFPVDVPLTPTLRVRWSWRLEGLWSPLPEDTLLTHDYFSVALEFDDGQDLTWIWSSSLPAGFSFTCPLEHWRHRETHIVVRTGPTGIGEWRDEERPVLADHQVAIGGPAPARVTHAWLIAVSLFQLGDSHAEVRRLELVDGDQVVSVL